MVSIRGIFRRLGIIESKNIEKDCSNYIEEAGNEEWEVSLRKKVCIQGEYQVRNGLFQGLRYPELVSTCSSIWPKIIGSYEKELQSAIEDSMKNEYRYMFDVGCAEGYYAIGMALLYKKWGKNTHIIAFDNDENAIRLCSEMRKINQVEDCVEIKNWCSPDLLQNFDFGHKSLIFADCEGYERELFNKQNITNLLNVDLIVEIHDWNQFETPTLDYLIELFSDTHNVNIINGIDDYEKAYRYKFPETTEYDIATRFKIFAEGRRRCGIWLYIKSHK